KSTVARLLLISDRNDFRLLREVRMRQGEFALVSGAQGQEQLMEVLSNNLANVDTPGFKKDRVTFKTYMPHKELLVKKPESQPGTNLTPWGEFPIPGGSPGRMFPIQGLTASMSAMPRG
ncbi:flagellar basal body rod protein, partial [mine drainage metagenome]